MKMKHKVLSTAIASVLALGVLVPTAQAEVEVSAEVAASSMYLWRGIDLGGGAALSGDLSVSASGFYAGLWTSSGDKTMGTEYDIYLGYATEIGDFGIDVGYATYIYPNPADEWDEDAYTTGGVPVGAYVEADAVKAGDLAEVYAGLSYGPASLTYYHGVEDLEDYWYAVAGVDVGSFNFSYGRHEDDMSHVDVTYSYNDNLSFTLSKVVDDVDESYNDEAKFMVSVSLPIEF